MTGHHHHHHHPPAGMGAIEHRKALWLTLCLTAGYMLLEVIGGLWAHSLALLSDAAHMLTDVAALAISLAAIHIAQRSADARRTFGYYRLEVLAATFNAVVLFMLALYILYEAILRIWEPQSIQSTGMLAIALIGLLINAICMKLLHPGSEQSLNLKSAYLEVWSDFISSLGVILAALVIHISGWYWVDPMIAVGIGLWVLPRAWTLLSESLNVLLEGVPQGVELFKINEALLSIEGVLDIHDLHVWAITSGQISLTSHLLIDNQHDQQDILKHINTLLDREFHITHTTIQVEVEHCQPGIAHCNLSEHRH